MKVSVDPDFFFTLSQILLISKSNDLKEIIFICSLNSNVSPIFVTTILTFLI